MPSYSRNKMYPAAGGDVPRITGLNSFGQPFRGRKIRGVGAEERRVGLAYSRELSRGTGPLSTRHQDGSQGAFAKRKFDEAEVAREQAAEKKALEAAERGRAAAKSVDSSQGKFATAARRSLNAVKAPKRQGMLIPGSSPGSAIWKSGEELDAMDAAKKKARLTARRTVDYTPIIRPETVMPFERME